MANVLKLAPLERRRAQRIRLQIPIFVRGLNHRDTEFLELTKTIDISSMGSKLIGQLPLQENDMISLTIPAPVHSAPEFGGVGTPPIQARVVRVERGGDLEVVAVEFLHPLD